VGATHMSYCNNLEAVQVLSIVKFVAEDMRQGGDAD